MTKHEKTEIQSFNRHSHPSERNFPLLTCVKSRSMVPEGLTYNETVHGKLLTSVSSPPPLHTSVSLSLYVLSGSDKSFLCHPLCADSALVEALAPKSPQLFVTHKRSCFSHTEASVSREGAQIRCKPETPD